MEVDFLLFVVFMLILVFVFEKTVFIVQETQRLVVLRFGRLEKIIGPGLCILVPFIDLAVVVELSKSVPDWQKMNQEDLNVKIADLVKSNPNPKAFK